MVKILLIVKDVKDNTMDLKYKKISDLNENNFRTVLKNYKFNQEDANNLNSIKSFASSHTKELLKGFYKFIFDETVRQIINTN